MKELLIFLESHGKYFIFFIVYGIMFFNYRLLSARSFHLPEVQFSKSGERQL